jgi:hypoxanthine phosphoribosyltransferase
MQTGGRQEEVERVLQEADRLYTPEQVRAAMDHMAQDIADRLAGHDPLLLGCMVGGHVPLAMLLERLHFPLEADYLHATRYRGGTSGTDLQWLRPPPASVAGRTVLIVDDLLDEGHTLAAVVERCRAADAREVYTAVIIDKQVPHRPLLPRADFAALTAPNRYLFGYGMDYKGYLRNAPGIYAVKGM